MTTTRKLIAEMILHRPIDIDGANEEEMIVLACIYEMQKQGIAITTDSICNYAMESRHETEPDYAAWIKDLVTEYQGGGNVS